MIKARLQPLTCVILSLLIRGPAIAQPATGPARLADTANACGTLSHVAAAVFDKVEPTQVGEADAAAPGVAAPIPATAEAQTGAASPAPFSESQSTRRHRTTPGATRTPVQSSLVAPAAYFEPRKLQPVVGVAEAEPGDGKLPVDRRGRRASNREVRRVRWDEPIGRVAPTMYRPSEQYPEELELSVGRAALGGEILLPAHPAENAHAPAVVTNTLRRSEPQLAQIDSPGGTAGANEYPRNDRNPQQDDALFEDFQSDPFAEEEALPRPDNGPLDLAPENQPRGNLPAPASAGAAGEESGDDASALQDARDATNPFAAPPEEDPLVPDPAYQVPRPRSGMDPEYLQPTSTRTQPVTTISQLLGSDDTQDPYRERLHCDQVWQCAGGRCQSRCDGMMRNLARNCQVVWSNRCCQCGGYEMGHGCNGGPSLCGPVFGSRCSVRGAMQRHGVLGACSQAGCTTAHCTGSCLGGPIVAGAHPAFYGGPSAGGLHPCTCGGDNLAPPWTAWDALWGGCPPRTHVGGWTSAGYHSRANGLFNDHPHRLNVHQSWLYVERVADASRRAMDFGYRFDVLYGVDAQNTQAFGNQPGAWDWQNGWDHGIYGWALPQAYVEWAAQDVSVIAGHFYTIMGHEVVQAPDNFFYSHAMTMVNSEPFTHTGVLATWSRSEYFKWFGGWTLGWDTGFDQFGGGNSFLGGFQFQLLDFLSATYTNSFGDFGRRGTGYAHSIVFASQLPNQWAYVLQSDVLRVDGEDNVGVNQYLTYELSPRLALGTRLEWWKGDGVTAYAPYGATLPTRGSWSYYGVTFGANVRVGRNLVIRPESRLDWSPALDYSVGVGAVDMVMTY